MVKAELGQLTALTLAQMGANLLVESRAQVPRGATLKVLRELVVAVAGRMPGLYWRIGGHLEGRNY